MTAFHDLYSAHAADYRAYRPTYPPELFEYLARESPTRGLAWDCGTGNGQAAVALADHFERVIATDASAEQIRHAELHPRVEYIVAPAERGPLGDGTVSLVTVAQALHWFDLDRFYAEASRVCRPGGLLAAWTYERVLAGGHVDSAVAYLRREFLDAYWPPERAWVDDGYRTIPFPFDELRVGPFFMRVQWDLARFLGYLNTWSATKRFAAANGFNPVDRLTPDFRHVWGDPATARTVTWPLGLRVGRVSA